MIVLLSRFYRVSYKIIKNGKKVRSIVQNYQKWQKNTLHRTKLSKYIKDVIIIIDGDDNCNKKNENYKFII